MPEFATWMPAWTLIVRGSEFLPDEDTKEKFKIELAGICSKMERINYCRVRLQLRTNSLGHSAINPEPFIDEVRPLPFWVTSTKWGSPPKPGAFGFRYVKKLVYNCPRRLLCSRTHQALQDTTHNKISHSCDKQ